MTRGYLTGVSYGSLESRDTRLRCDNFEQRKSANQGEKPATLVIIDC